MNAMGIKCGNHGRYTVYHASVSDVRACCQSAVYAWPMAEQALIPSAAEAPWGKAGYATYQQVKFIERLLADSDPKGYCAQKARLGIAGVPNYLTRAEASRAIDGLKAAQVIAKVDANQQHSEPITKDGIYKDPVTNAIYKVQRNKAGGNGRRLYAKVLTGEDNRTFGWTYLPGLIGRIRPEWKMTREEAASFGRIYGVCVRCHRDLTDEGSIAAGIGPICAGKEGW